MSEINQHAGIITLIPKVTIIIKTTTVEISKEYISYKSYVDKYHNFLELQENAIDCTKVCFFDYSQKINHYERILIAFSEVISREIWIEYKSIDFFAIYRALSNDTLVNRRKKLNYYDIGEDEQKLLSKHFFVKNNNRLIKYCDIKISSLHTLTNAIKASFEMYGNHIFVPNLNNNFKLEDINLYTVYKKNGRVDINYDYLISNKEKFNLRNLFFTYGGFDYGQFVFVRIQ